MARKLIIFILLSISLTSLSVLAGEKDDVSARGDGGDLKAPLPTSATAALPSMSIGELLDLLDATLDESEAFERRKWEKITGLRGEFLKAADKEQRYWIARNLYGEYSTFDSDSALHYADVGYRMARELGRGDWMDEMQLDRAYVMAATGLLVQADMILAGINPENLQPGLEARYFEQLLFLSTHRDQFYGVNSADVPYNAEASQMLDSLCNRLSPDHSQYSWFVGWKNLNSSGDPREVIPQMKRSVDACGFATQKDAMDAWILSRLYEKAGDDEGKLRYLILSSIADIRAANKEIASLEEVANLMYEGDGPGSRADNLRRANDYISHCIICANSYKSRVRVGRLADLQQRITQGYQTELVKQERRVANYLKLLVAFVAGLLAAMVFIIVQMRKLRQRRALLNDANQALNGKVEELEQMKVRLEEANASLASLYSSAREGANELSRTNLAKEKYIADIFAICSNYISKLDDFRKNIYRMLIAGKYEEVRQLTKTPELSQAEIKELHRTFDKIFLGIYPDFVRDFNTLLRPDEQIELKKGDLLNTELRIYALVRLGLNDSTAIARFLHCSVQTVYNTRQRTRSKAAVPREEFAERVKSLGVAIF